MNMWLQWLLAFFVRSKGKPTLALGDVARLRFRVLPTDIDFLGHMNNGRYLSYMDLARTDMTQRMGLSRVLAQQGIYAVVGQSTMVYRKSLDFGQRFDIETAIAGADERAVYIEQRFVVDGEVYARGFVQGRFLRRGSGTVKIEDLLRVLADGGVDEQLPGVHPLVGEWAKANALPPTRADAPSLWDGRVPR